MRNDTIPVEIRPVAEKRISSIVVRTRHRMSKELAAKLRCPIGCLDAVS